MSAIDLQPWTDSPRTSLEILSWLAGGTTFKEPSAGHGGKPFRTPIDLATALGWVKDPLQQRLALALAAQTAAEWPAIQALAHPRLLRELDGDRRTKSLIRGWRRYRARLVLYEAFHDTALVRPPFDQVPAAKALHMPVADYRSLYKAAVGFIRTEAEAGAREACGFLRM